MTTVSSEIEKILQKVVYNAVKLSRLYELEAEYVPDCSEALSKLEELMVRARIDEIQEFLLSSNFFNADRSYSSDKTGFYVVDSSYIENRIIDLQKGEK